MTDQLEAMIQHEFSLARRDIERGASVVPYIVASSEDTGETYVVPFYHILDDPETRRAWKVAFKLFSLMRGITHYVTVSEAWSLDVREGGEEIRRRVEAGAKPSDFEEKVEILSVVGISREKKLLWKSHIARDGTLAELGKVEKIESDDEGEIGGLLTGLLAPASLGKMPEQFKSLAYETMNKSGFIVISR